MTAMLEFLNISCESISPPHGYALITLLKFLKSYISLTAYRHARA